MSVGSAQQDRRAQTDMAGTGEITLPGWQAPDP
jgi:hypothetical protein